MKTSKDIRKQFRSDLADLLDKYPGAEMILEDDGNDYYRNGPELMVYVSGVWDDNNDLVSEFTEIDLGNYTSADTLRHENENDDE